jgi:hypothetical protein
VASQRLVHGVELPFFSAPYPLGWSVDVADNRLTALRDMDMLKRHLLLAAAAVSLERLDLRGERPGELVESTKQPFNHSPWVEIGRIGRE